MSNYITYEERMKVENCLSGGKSFGEIAKELGKDRSTVLLLTVREAAAYSNIGINKLDSLLREPNCPFVLFVGTKKLVKRKEFEAFLAKSLII